jgi:hypothetical protein
LLVAFNPSFTAYMISAKRKILSSVRTRRKDNKAFTKQSLPTLGLLTSQETSIFACERQFLNSDCPELCLDPGMAPDDQRQLGSEGLISTLQRIIFSLQNTLLLG